jgi:hypothetical protein
MAQQQRHERQLQALRNDRELARFVVEGRATGKQLGTGSYGSVEEVCIVEGFNFNSDLIDLDPPTGILLNYSMVGALVDW